MPSWHSFRTVARQAKNANKFESKMNQNAIPSVSRAAPKASVLVHQALPPAGAPVRGWQNRGMSDLDLVLVLRYRKAVTYYRTCPEFFRACGPVLGPSAGLLARESLGGSC